MSRGAKALIAVIVLVWGGHAGAADLAEAVEAIPEADLIRYEPEHTAHTVTVFTDVNCPYSRELHQQLEDYLMWDIRVQYAAFPHIDDAYEKMEAVWCSEDRRAALDQAKQGKPVRAEACDNPVREQLELAEELGLQATPAIITPGGQVRYGVLSPTELLDLLEREADLEAGAAPEFPDEP